jgi:antitoxin CptB
MTNKDKLKKSIVYRSLHRGSKEMDLLLGNFVKNNINNFSESELVDLSNLIQAEDEILMNWYFKKDDISLPKNKVSLMFKKNK